MQTHSVDPTAQDETDADRYAFAAAGLLAGTRILTGDGEIPVEFLTNNDRIISRSHGMVRLHRIDAHVVSAQVVRLEPGALGAGRPRTPALIPAAQKVLVRDWRAKALFGAVQAIEPVGRLVDHETIRDVGTRETHIFSLHFTRPEVIYADGIEVAMASMADARRAMAA